MENLNYEESLQAFKDFIKEKNIELNRGSLVFNIDSYSKTIKQVFDNNFNKQEGLSSVCSTVIYSIILLMENERVEARLLNKKLDLYSLAILFISWYNETPIGF